MQQQTQQQQKPQQTQQQQQQKKPEPVKEEAPVPFFSEDLKDVPTITKLFPKGGYPEGEIQEYTGSNLWRSTSAEKKEVGR
jgi:methionyl aminopeptidase